ncbi:MAG: Maf family nucleotide pyrophosphatase [gamma proteobacterium symbiont of Bathyaustriella thionipta]|nr:Maf family nucleotide pyrophosphatase [gamma proteobacterium symbiont of Bathyaustriella thionipta]MCU7951467.1 Maf family nucleotide pyrophosphatase [gamma proteobacterium symbiont of Bathyaustriella thionipta]MCU7954892.1 Maf family nucleotide pyrophosphatase [gamma proteobacterium symbiont of Bathyaustriella thionipta]MCU7958035.1 Maf family nucleotide pyrophosphatase [gamma proteobacterium symbiont of Bathyaustriella thionipta]
MIHLASSSPRRQELLQQMGVSFKVIPQFAEEVHKLNESPKNYVSRLAREKAIDGLSRQNNQTIPVLGSDTAVILNGTILGKPNDKEQAINMLLSLSEQTHQVITAVAVINEQRIEQVVSITDVSFSKLTRSMCEKYWQTGEPADKAGSYGIQGQGALFISNINGSYSGVMGLPIYETRVLLNQFAISKVR